MWDAIHARQGSFIILALVKNAPLIVATVPTAADAPHVQLVMLLTIKIGASLSNATNHALHV
jgi:hypothetical protein